MVDLAITQFLAALEETQNLAPDRMQAYQRRLLDRLLRHARSQTDFYADRLAPLFRADDSIDWDRWTEIPILTRTEAQEKTEALFARTTPTAAGETRIAFTSGSTGRPLRHGNSAIQQLATSCANERFFRWHRINPAALAGFIIHASPDRGRYPEGARTTTWRLVDEDSPAAMLNIDTPHHQQVDWLRRTRPSSLTTFPSNLLEIGRLASEQGEPLSFDAMLTVGEAISPAMHAEIRDRFGRDPRDSYGTTELGNIAGTCPHSGKYHICADLVLVEILDGDSRPAAPGIPGRIVATSFYNFATPFIRYDTGDYGIGAAEPCDCGRTLPLLERIIGRARNIFRFSDGTSALPHLESEDVQPFVPHRQRHQAACRQYEFSHLFHHRPATAIKPLADFSRF